jgi:acetylornithine deacetylase
VFATLGSKDRDGIIFPGHTDTVPVDVQTWSSDPFRLAMRDGKLRPGHVDQAHKADEFVMME